MSDAGKPVREWRFYIDDMIGFAEKVLSYTESMDQAAFMASEITYDAVLRNLELTGEAATDPEVLKFVERRALMGQGIGYIDVHLLSSAALDGVARLWTRDRRLAAAATELELGSDEEG
jgi:hypothetical protein